jgi:hypothetical protein
VLKDNPAMLSVFRKRYPNAKIASTDGNEVSVTMNFEPSPTAPHQAQAASSQDG